MKKIIGIILLWLICGFYGWGTTMAEFNWCNSHDWAVLHESPRDNIGIAALVAAGGPIGAVVAAVITNFNEHGWTLYD